MLCEPMQDRRLLEALPVPVVVHRNGIILYHNKATSEIAQRLGYQLSSDADLTGLDAFQMLAPEEHQKARDNYDRIISKGPSHRQAVRAFMTPKGERFDALGSARPILWEGEAALLVVAVFLDTDHLSNSALDNDTGETMRTPQGGLTHREREVARLVAHGYSTENIALLLGIATSTVRTHLKSIFRKTRTHSRAELTRWHLGVR